MLNPALRVQWLSGIRMSTLQGLDLASQTILKSGNLLVYDIFQGKIHLKKFKKTFKNNLRKERISSAQIWCTTTIQPAHPQMVLPQRIGMMNMAWLD